MLTPSVVPPTSVQTSASGSLVKTAGSGSVAPNTAVYSVPGPRMRFVAVTLMVACLSLDPERRQLDSCVLRVDLQLLTEGRQGERTEQLDVAGGECLDLVRDRVSTGAVRTGRHERHRVRRATGVVREDEQRAAVVIGTDVVAVDGVSGGA